MVPNRDALMIFAIIDSFLRGADTHKRSAMLESFPQSFDYIPWRRVYKQVMAEAQSSSTAAPPTMDHWDANELSFGGAGPFWCFTELQRCGENVSRKTEDGQTWLSKSGRAPKNGFPDQVRVDKLVISGKVFHMIELTLIQEKSVLWKAYNCSLQNLEEGQFRSRISANPKTQRIQSRSINSIFAGTDLPSKVFENHFLIDEARTEMQIDQPQGQMEGVSQQQHMPTHELPMGSNMVPDSTRGCVSSIEPDEDSTYQEIITFFHKTKESFKHVAFHRKEEARWIVSTVQNAAASLKNMFNLLGINAEAESTRPCTQLTEPATTEANPDELAAEDEVPDQLLSCSYTHLMEPATTTEANPDDLAPGDESPDQLPSCSLEDSFFDVAMYLNLDGGNGGDIDPDEAM